jgi:hypothetical protein
MQLKGLAHDPPVPPPHTTLPPTDMSKVRGADCITASKSTSLDVRVLQVAERLARLVAVGRRTDAIMQECPKIVQDLSDIAAEIRDAATQRPRPVPECSEVIAIWNADTATELRDVWSGSSARRPEMEMVRRIQLLEKAMGRLLVIEARREEQRP